MPSLKKGGVTTSGFCVVGAFSDREFPLARSIRIPFMSSFPRTPPCRPFLFLQVADFARQGSEATHDVTLEAGHLTQFATSIEPHLRSLGLPTKVG